MNNENVPNQFLKWIQKTMDNLELQLCIDAIVKSGLEHEFAEYIKKLVLEPIELIDICKDFAKLHPDKFYVPEKRESYEKFIVLENGDE